MSGDQQDGGESRYRLFDAQSAINYEFEIKKGVDYPYVTFSLHFAGDAENPRGLQDFSRYSTAAFSVKCSQPNTLSFTAYTFEEGFTQLYIGKTYRPASVYFRCDRQLSNIEISLDKLEVPEWWRSYNARPLADARYNLAKTLSVVFGNSIQSPLDTPVTVTIDNLVLRGRNNAYFYLAATALLLQWATFLYWYLKLHNLAFALHIKRRLQKDMPLIAYQQLAIEPHKDKEKSALLFFIATEYANPDLSLELAASSLGINRNKINELLKLEVGLTFSAYLNKIRLAEAARLLAQNPTLNISEAAYSVGYGNISYFNKLFKADYGCTPKAFQAASKDGADNAEV